MRVRPVVLAGLVACSLPASAQVSTNEGALDQLGKPEAPARRPVRPAPHPRPAQAPASHPSAPKPAPAATAAPVKPAVPATPPAILALPPPVVVPLAHPPPTPVATVTADAPGVATPIERGVRVTFGADRADLNPATVEALRQFARGVADQSHTSVTILAYASGSADDPSTPRRLALERALAARAVLLQAGIASPRIYPRALGPLGGDTAPDRVDVVTGAPTPPALAPTVQGRAG